MNTEETAEASAIAMVDGLPMADAAAGLPEGGARQGNCLLLTINSLRMLVPRNMLAEVISFSFLKFATDSQTGLAAFEWRGHLVPHLKGSMLGDRGEVEPNADTKVAIFHGLKNPQLLPFYSFTITRSPSLLRVSEGDLEETTGVELHPAELMRISLGKADAFIPKVDYFENIIIDLMKQHDEG